MRRLIDTLRSTVAGTAVFFLATGPLAGQESAQMAGASELARQSLRPYVNVFIAYAIAIVLVLVWVISLTRRMSRLEKELKG